MAQRRQQISLSLQPEIRDTLEDMATRYWGGNKSKMVEWGIILASHVIKDPRTREHGIPSEIEALEVYCKSLET